MLILDPPQTPPEWSRASPEVQEIINTVDVFCHVALGCVVVVVIATAVLVYFRSTVRVCLRKLTRRQAGEPDPHDMRLVVCAAIFLAIAVLVAIADGAWLWVQIGRPWG